MDYVMVPCMYKSVCVIHKKGVRKIIAKQLAFACIKDGMPKQWALRGVAKPFYNYCDKTDFPYAEVVKCFDRAYKHNKKHVFLDCNTIANCGYCSTYDKQRCRYYYRKKLYKFLKELIKCKKESNVYREHGFEYITYKEIRDTAGIHEKTIRKILFDELNCYKGKQTRNYKSTPCVYIEKEQMDNLEKNIDDYVTLYVRDIIKEEQKGWTYEQKRWNHPTSGYWKSWPEEQEEREWERRQEREKEAWERRKREKEARERREREKEARERREREKEVREREAVQPQKIDVAQLQKKPPIDEGKSKGGRPKKEIDIRKVIELKQKGVSNRKIATIFDVTHPTIGKILNELQKPRK